MSYENTIRMLLEAYPSARQNIKEIIGIDINKSNSEKPITNDGEQQDHDDHIINITREMSLFGKDDDIYAIIQNKLTVYLEAEIKIILVSHNNIINDTDKLCKEISRKAIEKLPVAVNFLCLYVLRTLQGSSNLSIDIMTMLDAYPTLKKVINIHIEHIMILIRDFFERLSQDREFIIKKFHINEFTVKHVDISLGDIHAIGCGVVRCELGRSTIIYKTRSADNEVRVTELLRLLKKNGVQIRIGIPECLNRGNYCWHRNITFKDSNSLVDVQEYYRNMGSAIAFFYAIGGNDFHYDNIICVNNIPYFVDLECVFSGPVKFGELSDTILSTCIIPCMSSSPVDKYICGIGLRDTGKGHSFTKTLFLDKDKKVKLKSIPREIPNFYNRPVILNVTPDEIKTAILDGFHHTRTAMSWHAEKISKFIRMQSSLQGRVLLRQTKFYNDLLIISSHPRYTSMPDVRDFFIACALSQDNIPADIIKSEFIALKNWMIPAFYTDIVKGICSSANGDNIIYHDLFSNVSTLLEHNARFLSEQSDLPFHEKLISLSINSLAPQKSQSTVMLNGVDIFENLKNTINIMIGNKLYYKGKELSLNFISGEQVDQHAITKMNSSLYHGYSGALLLQICEYIINPSSESEHNIFNLYQFCDQLNRSETRQSYGCYDADGVFLYLDYILYKQFKSNAYMQSFLLRLKKIQPLITESNNIIFDFLNGIAGILIVCCRMYSISFSVDILPAIRNLKQTIIKNIIPANNSTVTWGKKMTGFAHGNSGIVYALMLANNIINDAETLSVVKAAINYEQQYKIPSGWQDLRHKKDNSDFNSWCHGAPGIYLARKAILSECTIESSELFDLIYADIIHYQQSTPFRGDNRNLSLCHGIYGNTIINAPDTPTAFSVEFDPWSDDKSLMTGKAGAVYASLFLNYRNFDLPNILLLK